jgi:aryl-alcohol dehydrogenase-like predicted oxidoreductase
METSGSIPLRRFGKTDVQISALGSGGHHLGGAKDEKTAVELVHTALDGGITFYDCCWEYSRGKAEDWLGKGLKGRRDQAFLMTKVCTHGRDASLATQMLEQSLRRLQTDHIDLWQIHGVGFANDPDLFIRPGGAAEALLKAKKEGKVRFVGFTGHKDPEVHLAMLNTGFPFDAVQMPLNPFDANFHQFSFEQMVLPVLNQRGIAVLGMKPICGHGEPVQQGIFTAQEMLHYAMSLPVTTTISGFGDMDILKQNLKIAQGFTPLSATEMQALRDRAKPYAADGRFEPYKVSLKYDNPEARMAHDFPIDMQQIETKQLVAEAQNTGRPFPQV